MHHLSGNLPSIVKAAAPFVSHYGYLAVGLLLLLESLGLPFPGETTLIAASLYAGIGRLNILVVILVAVIASVIGSNIGYFIGSKGGRRLVLRFGKYIFITKPRLAKLEKFFNKRGGTIVIFARFVDGLRQLNGIIAGFSNMTWARFVRFNLIGAVLWVVAWSSVGYYGGSHLATILRYQLYVVIFLVLAFIMYILFLVNKSKGHKNGR